MVGFDSHSVPLRTSNRAVFSRALHDLDASIVWRLIEIGVRTLMKALLDMRT